MIKNGILIFFYVDDIIFTYRKKDKDLAQSLAGTLKKTYSLTGRGPLQWFLDIEIIRDKAQRLIWLSQSFYIDKIANLVDTQQRPRPQAPIGKEELFLYEGLVPIHEVRRYQRKIGSLLFAAVNTRPDTVFAVSRLTRFMTNPSETHQHATDKALLYLRDTRTYALRLKGGDDFIVANDTSFTNNTVDHKSSQAYTMCLFGGLIG